MDKLYLYPNHEMLLQFINSYFESLAEYVRERTTKAQEHIEREKKILERKSEEEEDREEDGEKFMSE